MTAGLRTINADWNFWPDGFDRSRIWHTCAQLGFEGMELGVYRADDQLSAAAVSAIEVLVAETGPGVSRGGPLRRPDPPQCYGQDRQACPASGGRFDADLAIASFTGSPKAPVGRRAD